VPSAENVISNIKIVPNPYFKEKKPFVDIYWDTNSEGDIKIYIYNILGELIYENETLLQNKHLIYDLMTSTKEKISSGNYILVFYARTKSGIINIAKEKFAVLY